MNETIFPSLTSSTESTFTQPSVRKKPCPKNLTEFLNQLLPLIDQLTLKPQNLEKITQLNEKIKKIDKDLSKSNKKISILEGGKVSKVPLIGTLIKLFFQFYNDKLLHKEHQKVDHLLNEKEKYSQKIWTLRQSIESINEERLQTIFTIESQLRDALQKKFPGKEKYLNLYTQKVLPLVQLAKESINQRPFHFAAQAAAAKGKAVQAGLSALKNLAENRPIIANSEISSQQVFLLPDEGAVFKSSQKRAREEEEIVTSLFDLMAEQATVGSFDIKKASLEEFGMQLSQTVQANCYIPENLPPSMLANIRSKLSTQNRLLLEKYEKTAKIDDDLDNYHAIKKINWRIQLPTKKWEPISFQQLQKLYLKDELPLATLIQSAGKPLSLSEHLQTNSPLFRALNYLPALQNSPQTFYLLPSGDPEDQQAYQLCEQFRWTYFDQEGNQQEVDFKTLHSLVLQNETTDHIQPIPSDDDSMIFPTSVEINKALNIGWKVINYELMKIKSQTLSKLNSIQAKPFMHDMILLNDMNHTTLNTLLKRLTPNAEFNAILTGEVQLLDLYAKNLAVAPKSNAQYEYFKNLEFSIHSPSGDKSQKISFKDLILKYLAGGIKKDTLIEFKASKKTILKPLKELKDLQKALDVRWDFVIFDTDLSLTENNRLQAQFHKEIKGHLIPLRSCLLETTWKDRPLNDQTICRLMDSDARDLRVKQWVKKEDAPIYKKISANTKASIQADLAPLIQKYSLSQPREKRKNIIIKQLQDQFVQDLSNISEPAHLKIWKIIETDLSSVTVRSDDTLESIAKRYRQDIDTLQLLNPMCLGEKVDIHYDLTSSSHEALKRRERIAAQLFPRITHRQQTALLERQQCRKEYLSSYRELSQSKLEGAKLVAPLQDFIQKSTTPLSSIRREKLLQQLKKSSASELLNLKKAVIKECQPSYFNLMKAMYPLLADAYALNQAVYKDEITAGINIGNFQESLENTIQQAEKQFATNSPEGRMVKRIKGQIQAVKDPAFFGYWQ